MELKNTSAGWSGILVYIEHSDNQISTVTKELIGEAYRLSQISGQPVYGAAVGGEIHLLEEVLKGYPLEMVYLYETTAVFQPHLYEKAMVRCIQQLMPSIVLIGASLQGRALAPRLAVAFRTGLTADCTELDINNSGELIQTRPAFGGNIMASILTKSCRPQFATVRANVMPQIAKELSYKTLFHTEMLKDSSGSIAILALEPYMQRESITDQDILVVAGRGIKKKEDLQQLYSLARLLGGTLASSRALVEKGWMPPAAQIGLSGNTVRPKCMITFGVSGSVQFMAGMKYTENIIAVNIDLNAAIFDIAHYPICADLYDIVPELLQQLQTN